MSKDELEKIYEQLESAAMLLETISAQAATLAKVLLEIKDKLASGGGPGEEKH